MWKGGGTFDRLLDEATSLLLLETDWESILQICDLIRQGDIQAKYAIGAIKKKLNDKNPHVVLFTLEVLESVVKNCGQAVHDEVASKLTMEELKYLIKKHTEPNVMIKICYLIQAWAHAFRNEPKYKVVQDTYQIMKVEGHVFPEFKESDAMFAAERAPDWVDAEECHRCRVQFGVMTRKNHCRACGQIFCGKCSSKYSTIPKFGIEKEVRVCEPCYELLNNHPSLSSPLRKAEGKAPLSSTAALQFLKVEGHLFPEFKESDAMFAAERAPDWVDAEECHQCRVQFGVMTRKNHCRACGQIFCRKCSSKYSTIPKFGIEKEVRVCEPCYKRLNNLPSLSPPLRKAEGKAPLSSTAALQFLKVEGHLFPEFKESDAMFAAERAPDWVDAEECHRCSVQFGVMPPEQFLKALQNAVTTFLNRMKSNHMRGRRITNDSALLSLFQSINNIHPQLLDILNQLDERRLYYEGLQDKLAHVRDARAALNAQKLEIMRQKKQEYLKKQRQLAIQRLQEQEKERQMRLEAQKHTIQMRAQMPAFSLPYAQTQTERIQSRHRMDINSAGNHASDHGVTIPSYPTLVHPETPPERPPHSTGAMPAAINKSVGEASASSILSEENFRCSICLDVFTDPITTPCGHNYCNACITHHWDSSDVCKCPLCNKTFYRRPEFSVNKVLSEMVDQFRKSIRSSTSPEPATPNEVFCDSCAEPKLKALKSCLVCMASYCETHLEPHLRGTAFRRHKLINPVKNPEDIMCQKHDRPLELFCKTDLVCVCQFCTQTDHKSHQIVSLKEAYDGKKDELGKTEAEVQKMIQERQEKIQEVKHSVELSKTAADREIADSEKDFTALISCIQRSQAEVRNVIEHIKRSTEKQAEDLIKELQHEITQLERRSSDLKQLSCGEDHIQLLQNVTPINISVPVKDWTKVSVYPPSYVGTARTALDQLKKTLSIEMEEQILPSATPQAEGTGEVQCLVDVLGWPQDEEPLKKHQLEKALQSWFNRNVPDTSCSIQSFSDGRAEVIILPASALELPLMSQDITLPLRNKKTVTVRFLRAAAASRRSPDVQSPLLSSATQHVRGGETASIVSSPQRGQEVSIPFPLSPFVYLNQVYREEMKHIERDNGVTITAEVKTSFEVDRKNKNNREVPNPECALNEFVTLAQKCAGDMDSITAPLSLVNWKRVLQNVLRGETKLLLSVSCGEMSLSGPTKSMEDVRRALKTPQSDESD